MCGRDVTLEGAYKHRSTAAWRAITTARLNVRYWRKLDVAPKRERWRCYWRFLRLFCGADKEACNETDL